MDKKTAGVLLASLLQRIEEDHRIGMASSLEQEALRLAVEALSARDQITTASPTAHFPPDSVSARGGTAHAEFPVVQLALASVGDKKKASRNALMCLDFGTAMSKAFALKTSDKYIELELGVAAGNKGYFLPSSLFISNDGRVYFGFEAVEKSLGLEGSGRERIDSIKGWITLRQEGSLDGDANVVPTSMNPTDVQLTQGDLLRIYLAFFTDVAERALESYVAKPRYVKRRYAHPCWSDDKALWGNDLLRKMLAEAQILADTFTGLWSSGIRVGTIKAAIEKVKKLDELPDYLIDCGVPEPVAVAAGAIASSENHRDAYMVVDAGAGTTDFGLFIATKRADSEHLRVFQNSRSIRGLMQAGDKVDGLLRGFIAQKESIDPSDNAGKVILANLTRQIRTWKETLFKTGKLEYTLSDDTVGTIRLDEFLRDEKVKRFGRLIEEGFKMALDAVDDTYLRWLEMPGVSLHVMVTGGSSALPMVQGLTRGPIIVKGHRVLREPVDPRPDWLGGASAGLLAVYPQLAVAIGGTGETMPETHDAPLVFRGGIRAPSYVAGNLYVGGR